MAHGGNSFRGYLTQAAYCQTWTRERLPPDELGGQTQLKPDGTNLVFEKETKGLYQLELHIVGQTSNVVMGFDAVSLVHADALGFNNIRVDRALSQKLKFADIMHGSLKLTHEHLSDDFALLLGVYDTLQAVKVALGCVDNN